MKPEQTQPEERNLSPPDAADQSPTTKVRRLRPVNAPSAWDPYEVWRTRVKPKYPHEQPE